MIKRIGVRYNIIEMMYYYWQVTSEKGKVGETYIIELSDEEDMKYVYDDEFNSDSVRRVLSAISNREMLNSESKKERRFWNFNMWMLEDLGFTEMMVLPVKKLNLSSLVEKLNENYGDTKHEELEVIFVPGLEEEYSIVENKLIVNFFKIKADLYEEDKVTIGELPLVDYIEEKLKELLSK
ncbi:TDE2712 family protein [Anaerosalibacter sp. Marseille-P3206]|uniref:TDE2712 family protein n=1 Tax=Anaerosalibacter sp. Marseille-P3206 TaxID=1871005 RepID=UPI000985061F|nr:hypothetical protein [Anaerosalibacter sp. Marseille-P3206]